MIFDYEAKKFSKIWGRKLKGFNQIKTTWPQILHSAIMVGKKSNFELVQYKSYSSMEIIFRYSMTKAFLREDGINYISKSEVYENGLDPSEKGAISYFLGNVFTNFMSRKFLGVKYILHYDLYKDMVSTFTHGNKKPDFIAQNYRGEWIVLESKGRSNNKDNEAIKNARIQLKGIWRINNKVPVVKVAIQTFFLKNGRMNLYLEDPEEKSKDSKNLRIQPKDFIKAYYKLLFDLFLENQTQLYKVLFDRTSYIFIDLEEIQVEIGLSEQVVRNHLDLKVENLINHKEFIKENDYYIGRDGVFIVDYSTTEKNKKLYSTKLHT